MKYKVLTEADMNGKKGLLVDMLGLGLPPQRDLAENLTRMDLAGWRLVQVLQGKPERFVFREKTRSERAEED